MTISVTEQNNGGQITAQVGDTIEIHLAENATTGYRWEPDALDHRLFESEETTSNYRSGAIGSGGAALFRIKVLAAGSATLRLKCWRRWEGEGGVLKRFAIKVTAV